MNILDFIQITKENPLEFITYCEIIILPGGDIELVSPSHTETALEIAARLEGITKDELKSNIPKYVEPLSYIVSKYRLVAVWYNSILYNKLNRFQKHTIDLLKYNELISKEPIIYETNEYQNYLKRKKKGLE